MYMGIRIFLVWRYDKRKHGWKLYIPTVLCFTFLEMVVLFIYIKIFQRQLKSIIGLLGYRYRFA